MKTEEMVVRLREAGRLARVAAEIARTVYDGTPEEHQTATTASLAETAAIHLGIFSQDLLTEADALEREHDERAESLEVEEEADRCVSEWPT